MKKADIKEALIRIDAQCICQPKIRSKDHLILGHFLDNKCASENCTKAQYSVFTEEKYPNATGLTCPWIYEYEYNDHKKG